MGAKIDRYMMDDCVDFQLLHLLYKCTSHFHCSDGSWGMRTFSVAPLCGFHQISFTFGHLAEIVSGPLVWALPSYLSRNKPKYNLGFVRLSYNHVTEPTSA
jgi:hypothetical protein